MTAVRGKTLGIALAIPPILWIAQGAVGWFIAAHACPRGAEPMSFGTARLVNGLISVVAIVVTIAAVLYARRAVELPQDAANEPKAASDKAERSRYVAVFVLFVGITLTLGLVMGGLPDLMLRACGETR